MHGGPLYNGPETSLQNYYKTWQEYNLTVITQNMYNLTNEFEW